MSSMEKLFDLEGKVVIITGALGLLGTELCQAFAEHGSHVVVIDLDPSNCERRAADLSGKGTRTLGLAVDITRKDDVERMVQIVTDRFGRIDVIINNAQHKPEGFFAPFEDFSLEDWERVIAVNLTAVFICCQAVGRQMLKQGSGNIINVASTYGVVAPDHRIYIGTSLGCPAVYSASKGGVIMLTKYLAAYWGGRGIRVNAVTPHGIYNSHEKHFVDNFSSRSPLGRMCNRKEVVGAFLYLASDASSYVTGHNLIVDGGWTTW